MSDDRDGRDQRPEALDEELAALHAQSRARYAELRAIAAELPAVTSRRVVVKQLALSVRDAPDKSTVARRTFGKILRTPSDLLRRGRG